MFSLIECDQLASQVLTRLAELCHTGTPGDQIRAAELIITYHLRVLTWLTRPERRAKKAEYSDICCIFLLKNEPQSSQTDGISAIFGQVAS